MRIAKLSPALVVLAAAACKPDTAEEPEAPTAEPAAVSTPAPPSPPPTTPTDRGASPHPAPVEPNSKWSDFAGDAGVADTVVIEAGQAVLLDQCDVNIDILMIHGALAVTEAALAACSDGIELTASAVVLMGDGALLEAGRHDAPLPSGFTVTFKGTDPDRETNPDPNGHAWGTKGLVAMMGGQLELHGLSAEKATWSQIDGALEPGDTSMSLVDTPGWQAGDRVVLAPSGYDIRETEELTVVSVRGRTVNFTPALRHAHHGSVEAVPGGKAIDMRAEVGLLSHSILLRGDAASAEMRFGGHVMITHGGGAHVTGVEFQHMGQQGKPGRYPFHWHHAGDVEGQYVRNSSVHHSFQRAFASHVTDNSRVQENVAYHVANHAYVFSEDGPERGNIYENNLGLFVYPPQTLAFTQDGGRFSPSTQNGDRPGVFWGRSPNNTLRGNRAAGTAQGNGFFIDSHEAKEIQALTPQAVFEDNASHSNALYHPYASGPEITGKVQFERTWGYHKLPGNALFTSLEYPSEGGEHDAYFADTDRAHDGNVYELTRFSAYKNSRHGAWLETRYEALRDSVIAESMASVRLDGGFLLDTVLVDGTGNEIGEPTDRIMCTPRGDSCLGRKGIQGHKGAAKVADVTFSGLDGAYVYFDGVHAGLSRTHERMTYIDTSSDPVVETRIAKKGSDFGGLIDLDGTLSQSGRTSAVRPEERKDLESFALTFEGVRDGETVGTTLTLTARTFNSQLFQYTYYLDGEIVRPDASGRFEFTGLAPGLHYVTARPTRELNGGLGNARGQMWFMTYFRVD